MAFLAMAGFLIHPLPDGFAVAFVGAFDGPLGGEAPALETSADLTPFHFDFEQIPDEVLDGFACAESEGHLQLVVSGIAFDDADLGLPVFGEDQSGAFGAPLLLKLDNFNPACLVRFDPFINCISADFLLIGNLARVEFLEEANSLAANLLLGFRCQ